MFLPLLTHSRLLAPSLVIVAVLASIQSTEAKSIRSLGLSKLRTSNAIKMRRGGCAAFGHSCFGGHGKRSEVAMNLSDGEEAPAGFQPLADDVRGFLMSEGSRTPLEIFSREQPDNELNLIAPSPYQFDDYVKFSPLFRKWIPNNYRRGELIVNNQ